jgi:hypothetical protein
MTACDFDDSGLNLWIYVQGLRSNLLLFFQPICLTTKKSIDSSHKLTVSSIL